VLTRLYSYLSGIRPFSILLIYLALIPVFAAVFCVLPGQQFYAPYGRLEPIAFADSAEVQKNITTAMQESYRGHEALADGWQIARSDIEADDLTTDVSNGLTFTVYYFATKHAGGKITASVGGPQFTARLSKQRIVTVNRPGRVVCHLITLPPDASDGGPATFNQHLLFRSPEIAMLADSVCWGAKEEFALQNLVSGWSGDPHGLSGFPGRMTYFSATTITTVGFGDIVPLTATARVLTAVEAIAGWVLAGFFLNSLASRIAKGRA
jgi:hypothetical protein